MPVSNDFATPAGLSLVDGFNTFTHMANDGEGGTSTKVITLDFDGITVSLLHRRQ